MAPKGNKKEAQGEARGVPKHPLENRIEKGETRPLSFGTTFDQQTIKSVSTKHKK